MWFSLISIMKFAIFVDFHWCSYGNFEFSLIFIWIFSIFIDFHTDLTSNWHQIDLKLKIYLKKSSNWLQIHFIDIRLTSNWHQIDFKSTSKFKSLTWNWSQITVNVTSLTSNWNKIDLNLTSLISNLFQIDLTLISLISNWFQIDNRTQVQLRNPQGIFEF